jgi:hypothetical protein
MILFFLLLQLFVSKEIAIRICRTILVNLFQLTFFGDELRERK